VERKRITIVNKLGLHARAAAKFVTLASRFKCDVRLLRGEKAVSGKSIMGVMMLAAAKGTELELIAEGVDAAQALVELERLVNERFGETD